METFNQLFARMLAFIYHCFDRVVVNGYLSMLSRPENVVYFFRQVVGVPRITKEVLMQRTQQYQTWVEAYAFNHILGTVTIFSPNSHLCWIFGGISLILPPIFWKNYVDRVGPVSSKIV